MFKKKVGRFFLKFLSIAAFAMVSFWFLFLAFGYQIDPFSRHIQKTSIIDMAARYKDVQITLDGHVQKIAELPFQLKGVLPGLRTIAVVKSGFLPWKRQLEVQVDVVSKIDDLLLFPENLKLYQKLLNSFVQDVSFYFGKDALVVMRHGQNYLTLITFFDDGHSKQDEIQLDRSDLKNIQVFTEGRLLVSFNDGSFDLIDNNNQQFVHFILPMDQQQLKIGFLQQALYYVRQGVLYRIPFDKLAKLDQKNLIVFKIRLAVDHFSLSNKGIYYLSQGSLFSCNDQGGEVKSVPGGFLHSTNLSYFPGRDSGFMVLRNQQARSLYVVEPKGTLRLLGNGLDGDFLLNDSDQMLYTLRKDKELELRFYDAALNHDQLIQKFSGEFKLLSWFGQDGHFIYTNGSLFLSDWNFTNVYPLALDSKLGQLFIKNQALYYLLDYRLESFYFSAS